MLRRQSRYKSKYKMIGVLPIRIVKSNVSSVGPSSGRNSFPSDDGPTLETLDFTISVSAVHQPYIFRLLLFMSLTCIYNRILELTGLSMFRYWRSPGGIEEGREGLRGRDLEGGIEREDFYTWKFTRFCTESLVVRPSYKCVLVGIRNFGDRLTTKIIFQENFKHTTRP